MNILSVTGLGSDLLGVLLLGYDLVRVQRRIQQDAEDRVSRLEAVLEEIGGIDAWAETVGTDFREWSWEEGRTVMLDGTFDPRAARESFDEALRTISAVGIQVLTLARMQMAAIDGDRSTSRLSLRYTYWGLALIVCGFFLQLPAYF